MMRVDIDASTMRPTWLMTLLLAATSFMLNALAADCTTNSCRCGTSYETAESTCAATPCPSGVDAPCPSGQRCYLIDNPDTCSSTGTPAPGGTCSSLPNLAVRFGYWQYSAAYRTSNGSPCPGSSLASTDVSSYTHLSFFNVRPPTAKRLVSGGGPPYFFNTDQFDIYTRHFKPKLAASPGLKGMITIGGYQASGNFPAIAANATLRSLFISKTVKFCVSEGLAGADVDWEFPKPAHKANFVRMMQEMRRAFDAKGLSLVVGMPISADLLDSRYFGYDVPALAASAHWLNTYAYDLGDGTGKCAPHTSLPEIQGYFAASKFAQVPKSKLVFGLAAYGKTATITDGCTGTGLGCACTPGSTAANISPCLGYNGDYAYFDVQALIARGGVQTAIDTRSQTALVRKGSLWVTYDAPETYCAKLQYAAAQGMRGWQVFSVDEWPGALPLSTA